MRISIVTFTSVRPDKGRAAEHALALAYMLYKKKLLYKITSLEYDSTLCGIPEPFFESFPSRIDYLLRLMFTRFDKIFCVRYLREVIFDFFVSKNKKLMSSDVILFLKPPFLNTLKHAKKNGILTIAFASILHPIFNYLQVKSEQSRINIKEFSPYTYFPRVKYLTNFFSNVDYLIVPSYFAYKNFLKYGIPEDKIYTLEFGCFIDPYRFRPFKKEKNINNSNFVVLHVSHMGLIKGLSYLFEAWNMLNLKNAKLLLVGTVSNNSKILINKFSPKNTIIVGPVYDLNNYYNKADVFVSPSISDLNPYTVLEAMACGIPVIVSNRCGLSSIIEHGKEGFVYQYNDVKQLKYYIEWCYYNKKKLPIMGKAARDKASKYTKDNFLKAFYNILCKILKFAL